MYFDFTDKIVYEGPGTKNPFAFRYYNAGASKSGSTVMDCLYVQHSKSSGVKSTRVLIATVLRESSTPLKIVVRPE